MNAHALTVLEFPAVAARLAATARTTLGSELAAALTPSADVREVERRQALTAETIALLDESEEPALDGVHDVREEAAHAARGGVLSPDALARVASTIAAGLQTRASLAEHREDAVLLAEIAAAIEPALGDVADEIGRRVNEDGDDLRDNASPRLRKLRSELRDGRHRVAEELRRLARSPGLREHLQEDFVVQRGGRPVLAVKSSARRSVRGIVHDASGSGQTVFVEPFEVVELNNRHAEVAADERDEVTRILRELSSTVGARADAIEALVVALGEIDLALARGMLSRGWRGTPVAIADEVQLVGARHPLLEPATAVPIDLELGRLRVLVISGPNTGGKTVALKTLGLAALLHQSGLRPPAESASLPVFDHVLADIGDEQSIAMSLSTFSAHVSNLVAILGEATERSLVLVDELASGTDPEEGAALARALLSRLARQARLTLATTHYADVKEWASAEPDAANAATGLDPETNAPLYRVVLGRPGTSHALQMAAQIGLDADVVDDARSRIAPERLRIAELLAEAEAAEGAAVGERAEAERELAEARRVAERLREREAELETEVERVQASVAQARREAVAEAERELAAARVELDALREEIRLARRRDQAARRAAAAVPGRAERDRDRRLGAASKRAARAEQAIRSLDEPLPVLAPLAVGDPVEAPAIGVRGTIAAIDGDEAEVVGPSGQRVRIALARLRPDAHPAAREEQPQPAVRVLASASGDVSDQLDVRGRRAHEAREAVRAFVDDAALAGLPTVHVVHGRGTGAIRAAVREELRQHPLVERHESDSSDGATLVHLARAGA